MKKIPKKHQTQKNTLSKIPKSSLIDKNAKKDISLIQEEAFNILAKRAPFLLEKQIELALGDIRVFVSRSYWKGKGKNRKLVKTKPKLITDEQKISEAIDYNLGIRTGKEKPNVDLKYYFVVVKEPNLKALKALKSLLDRILGKPTKSKSSNVEHKMMGELLDELENQDKE